VVVAASPHTPIAVQISQIRFEPPDLAITVENDGPSSVDLTGWHVRVGSASAKLPDGIHLDPSSSVTLRTGEGQTTSRDVFLGDEATALLAQIHADVAVTLRDASNIAVASATVPRPASAEAEPATGAGRRLVDPRDIALSVDELPPGFVVVDDATRIEVVMITLAETAPSATQDDRNSDAQTRPAGVRYETELRRDQIGDGFGEGRLVIGQTITRLDEFLRPADILSESRDILIRDGGFASVLEPPDSDQTVRLVKRTATDTIYTVGMLKGDTVIFTSVRGVEPFVDLHLATTLADRSAAKYDLLSATPGGAAHEESGLRGQVVLRPRCPGVEREGPECEPRPAAATITVLTDTGGVVARLQTAADGFFQAAVPPGTYVLHPEVSGVFGSADDQEVVVSPGRYAEVTITYNAP
jgi:hypothetical protein